MGVTQYHLYTLEKEQKIISRRNGLYKRFFPALAFAENQQEILDALSQETERDILLYVIQNPGSTQKELSQYSRLSPGTINWHMKRLAASGLVSLKREGQYVRYSVPAEREEILNLVRNYHPNTFQLWVDRFANAIDAVTQLSDENIRKNDHQEVQEKPSEAKVDQTLPNRVQSEGTNEDVADDNDQERENEKQS